MVIYIDDAGNLRADYFDSEGHINHYAGKIESPSEIVFLSEPTQSEPGFRLAYHLAADGILAGSFDFASLQNPEEFMPYLSWAARKAI